MKNVWQVTWNMYLNSLDNVKELLDETYKDDIMMRHILFTTREKAEEYVEKVSKKIAEVILIEQINDSEDEDEKGEWESRSYEKVRWDEASEEKLDQHEHDKITATTYWIEPEHSFDHFGMFIAQVTEIQVR